MSEPTNEEVFNEFTRFCAVINERTGSDRPLNDEDSNDLESIAYYLGNGEAEHALKIMRSTKPNTS